MKTVFSKIIDKEIPCYLVAENNFAIAFMDINPISKGHVLVVPKTQVDYLFDLIIFSFIHSFIHNMHIIGKT